MVYHKRERERERESNWILTFSQLHRVTLQEKMRAEGRVSNWILTSCQTQKHTSGRANERDRQTETQRDRQMETEAGRQRQTDGRTDGQTVWDSLTRGIGRHTNVEGQTVLAHVVCGQAPRLWTYVPRSGGVEHPSCPRAQVGLRFGEPPLPEGWQSEGDGQVGAVGHPPGAGDVNARDLPPGVVMTGADHTQAAFSSRAMDRYTGVIIVTALLAPSTLFYLSPQPHAPSLCVCTPGLARLETGKSKVGVIITV